MMNESESAGQKQEKKAFPRIAEVVIDCTSPRRLAEFYRKILGYEYLKDMGQEMPEEGQPDPAGDDWLNLMDPEKRVHLAFQKVDRLPRSTWPEDEIPQQMHLDLMVRSREELDRQHQVVLELGGVLLREHLESDQPIRIYADPEGHPFCIFVADWEV